MITILSSLFCLSIGFLIGYFWNKPKVTIRISEMKADGDRPLIETKGNVKVIIKSNNLKTSNS